MRNLAAVGRALQVARVGGDGRNESSILEAWTSHVESSAPIGITPPRNIKQHTTSLPCLGSHSATMDAGTDQPFVISATEIVSWRAFSAG